MGIMVYSLLLWVMQDLFHQPYGFILSDQSHSPQTCLGYKAPSAAKALDVEAGENYQYSSFWFRLIHILRLVDLRKLLSCQVHMA